MKQASEAMAKAGKEIKSGNITFYPLDNGEYLAIAKSGMYLVNKQTVVVLEYKATYHCGYPVDDYNMYDPLPCALGGCKYCSYGWSNHDERKVITTVGEILCNGDEYADWAYFYEPDFRVLLAPSLELAKEVKADASVEAEYGDECVNGKSITLAHHGSRAHNPAPCNAEVAPLDSGTILVSHLDLDTIGGVLAVMGIKPEDSDFWKGAEFIDMNGPHHIHELPENVQDQLNAVYAWNQGRGQRYTEITDVTDIVFSWLEVLIPILTKHRKCYDYIQAGKDWREKITAEVEAKLVSETDTVRAFITDGVFCSAAYYSSNLDKICKATAVLNTKFNSVTISFADGGKEISARELVQKLWGPEAGGRDAIAGSPRNWQIDEEELRQQFDIAVARIEELI